MPTMAPEQKMELLMMAYRAIFPESGLIDLNDATSAIRERFEPWALRIAPRMFKDSSNNELTIPGIELVLDIGETNPNNTLKPKNLRCIAQNPNKRDANGNLSQTAILARAGHKIMWVIDQDVENGFLGSIKDGNWEPSRPRATYPASGRQLETAIDQTGNAYQRNEGGWVQNLPEMDRNNIDQEVTEYLDGDENDCGFTVDYGVY